MGRIKRNSTIYYSDPLNDDFNDLGIERKDVPDNYKYKRENPIYNFFAWIEYHILAKMILGTFCFFKGIKVKGRKNLKEVRKKGAILYHNHTTIIDAFQVQSYIDTYQRVNIVGFSDALNIPVAKYFVRGLGILPISSNPRKNKKLCDAIKFYLDKGQHILIYPEAHIWPYYTGIRPFLSTSFHYPAKYNVPIVPMCTTYRKGLFNKPKETIYIGKAIYPKEELSIKENKEYLRDACYNYMVNISSSINQYKYVNYEYREQLNKE